MSNPEIFSTFDATAIRMLTSAVPDATAVAASTRAAGRAATIAERATALVDGD